MDIRVLDMFCGAGGSSAGARAAGGTTLYAVDAWDLAAITFRDNFAKATVDIRTLTPRTPPSKDVSEGEFDLIAASPECTNHSPAKGSKPRCEDSRGTSRYVLAYAAAVRPRWIVLENVVQLRNWDGYQALLNRLRELGYKVSPQVLDASDFGVPQTRRRLFVICDREAEPPLIKRRTAKRRPASSAINLEGPWPSRPLRCEGRAQPTLERAQRGIDAVGRNPFLIVYYGSDGAGGWQPLDRPLRTLTTLDRFGLVTWNGREPMLRMLQVDELRAAMGFPRAYAFNHGSRRDRIKMIGNAVAPPVMAAIIEALSENKTHRIQRSRRLQDLGAR
jgi:DNA (cytosine-5)-methyltransferase 1